MSFTQVSLTGTLLSQTGAVIAGASVRITLSHEMSDGSTGLYPANYGQQVVSSSSGTFSVTVPANDDSTTVPVGTYYTCVITDQSQRQLDSFQVVVPHASAPSVDLFSLARLGNAPSPATPYVISVNGESGIVSGVAPTASPTFTGTVSGITAAMVGADTSGAAAAAQANAEAASVPNPGTTTFPTALDTAGSSAAILALEAKVGVNGSAVTTSLDYFANHSKLGQRTAVFANNLSVLHGLASERTCTDTSATYKAPPCTVLVPCLGGITATFSNSGADAAMAGPITMGFSIPDSAGVYHQFTYLGATTWSVAAGETITTDPCTTLSFPTVGATFNPITWVSSTVAGQWPYNSSTGYFNDSTGWGAAAGYDYGAASSTLTGGATFTNPTGTDIFAPSSIQGNVSANTRAVVVIGDSWLLQQNGLNFATEPLTTLGVAWIMSGLIGDTVQNWATTTGALRVASYAGCTDAIGELSTNDFQAGLTVAQIQAYVLSAATQLKTAGVQRIYWTTVGPSTTGTASSQTLTASSPLRETFNIWVRAGFPTVAGVAVAPGTSGALLAGQLGHPLTDYIEINDPLENPKRSGYWAVADFNDGLHPSIPTGINDAATGINARAFGGFPSLYTPPVYTGIDNYFPNLPYTNVSQSLVLTVGLMWHVPFEVFGQAATPSIVQIVSDLSGYGSTGSTIRFAIYSVDSRGRPAALVQDCGTRPGDSAGGGGHIATSFTLPPGRYTLACYTEGNPATAPTLTGALGCNPVVPTQAFSAVLQNCYIYTVSATQVGAPATLADGAFSAFGTTAPLVYGYTLS